MAVLVILSMLAGPVAARTLDQPPAYIKKEGSFVVYPATAFAGLGLIVGGALALPAALVSTPIGFAAGDPLGYALFPSAVVGSGLAEVGYHVGGVIPYAIKKTLYTGPLYVAQAIKGDALSGMVAHVEPAPEFAPIDLQYLESTPADARLPVDNARRYSLALPPPRQTNSLMLKRQLSPFRLPPSAAAAEASRRALSRPPMAPASVPAPAQMEVPVEPSVPTVPVETASAPEPVALPSPPYAPAQPATAVERAGAVESPNPAERPSLRKKKRKFSERFGL